MPRVPWAGNGRGTAVHTMGTHVCLETPNILIGWEDDEGGYLFIRYTHLLSAQQVRDATPAFLEAVREHHATRCLSDSRQRRLVQPDAQEAFISAVAAGAANGLRRMAVVLPQSVVTQTTLVPLVARYQAHLEAAFFGSMEEAMSWLMARVPQLAEQRLMLADHAAPPEGPIAR